MIAFQLAWGGGGGQADQSGAMATLAQNGFGKVLLWAGAAGFAALAFWCLSDAILDSRGPDGSRRVGETVALVGQGGAVRARSGSSQFGSPLAPAGVGVRRA